MTVDIDTLLEGSPAYGVIDAKDGYLLHARQGHEAAFHALAEEVEASAEGYEVIPLKDDADRCDRLFIAPLTEEKSFAPRD
jgi:hypothetical protein